MRTNNRWVIAIAGVFLQIALGAVYAWSVFRVPLAKQFGWSISEVTLTFTISIFVLGFAAFFGGLWLNRKGPRVVALTGGVLYGLGVFLASFSHQPVVVISDLWRDRRNWPWSWLHRSSGGAGEVVSGPQRTHYRNCGWRIWRGRAHHRACGYATHSKRRRLEHIRLSRDRISDRHGCNRIIYAESTRWLEA